MSLKRNVGEREREGKAAEEREGRAEKAGLRRGREGGGSWRRQTACRMLARWRMFCIFLNACEIVAEEEEIFMVSERK